MTDTDTDTDTDVRFPYEDPGLAVDQRVDDLVSRMTLADKAGLLFQQLTTADQHDLDAPGPFGFPSASTLLAKGIRHMNILAVASARGLAEWHNAVQAQARTHPLRIPVTIASDPRHHFSDNPLANLLAGPFSQWPEPLGFGALRDRDLVRRFADTVRREYRAVGIHTALHPQIDLASDPRWCRTNTTFGQDAHIAGRLGAAYILGLQGQRLGVDSVAAAAKHWPGGGAQLDGEDPHFPYGQEQVWPGGQFDRHVAPFREAIDVGVAAILPYYGVPTGMPGVEEVGFAFNKHMITVLLREQLGYDGILLSDWSILSLYCWGVQDLTYEQRMVKALDAGIDQFGGESTPEVLVGLVKAGQVAESRLDQSVRRVLRPVFALGLFEQPFVDATRADEMVGTPAAREAGLAAQAAAHTVLRNADHDDANHLPLTPGVAVYVEGMDPAVLAGRARVVDTPAEADVAILRLAAPWEQRGEPGSMETFMHAGSLAFPAAVIDHIRDIHHQVPTIVDVYLERAAILTEIDEMGVTLIANFGATSEAAARVLFGQAEPLGRLPIDLPSSMDAVVASLPDVPGDTEHPLYQAGHGLRYHNWQPSPAPTGAPGQ